MSIFQIIASLFALFMIYVVNIHHRKLKLELWEVAFWYTNWILFITFSLFPDLLLGITHRLNFTRVFDLLLVIALMVITLIVVMSHFNHRSTNKKIEDLVRNIAIKKLNETTK